MVAAVVTDVTSGSLTLNGDGGFTYTPSTGFSGQLYFFYRATNDDGPGNVARVVLNVSHYGAAAVRAYVRRSSTATASQSGSRLPRSAWSPTT